jgi:Serine carboxypeptidase S28
MILNAHHENEDTNAYFDHVSNVAERAWPGCANGTRETLKALYHDILVTGVKDMADILGICYHRIPEYMKASVETFARELSQLVVSINADANMEYYPPSEATYVTKLCQIFCNNGVTHRQRYADFLLAVMESDDYQDAKPTTDRCFDFQTQLPDGMNATISSADWSGAGFSTTATRWEFQVCKDLVIKAGFAGPNSMFYPPREWTLDWLTEHCQNRFGTTLMPQPGRLNHLWSFDNLEGSSRIIFTNGENDGWIKGSYTHISTDSVIVINFGNGSHHSDLAHEWPRDDTIDIVEGHERIVQTLRKWLRSIY